MRSALISLAFSLAAAGSVGAAGSGAAIAAAASSAAAGPDATATTEAGPLPTATGATGGAPLGWNSFHALYCVYFIDTNGNQWTYLFSKETPSAFFFTENIPYWADAFRSACPNGSLVGIHITNSTNGTFDQVAVYGPGF